MAKQKEAWDKLSMLEKALLIKLSVDNGVSSLKLIRDTYNLYSNGGDLVHKKSGEELGESSYIQKLDNTSIYSLPIIDPVPVLDEMRLSDEKLAALNHAKALYANEGLEIVSPEFDILAGIRGIITLPRSAFGISSRQLMQGNKSLAYRVTSENMIEDAAKTGIIRTPNIAGLNPKYKFDIPYFYKGRPYYTPNRPLRGTGWTAPSGTREAVIAGGKSTEFIQVEPLTGKFIPGTNNILSTQPIYTEITPYKIPGKIDDFIYYQQNALGRYVPRTFADPIDSRNREIVQSLSKIISTPIVAEGVQQVDKVYSTGGPLYPFSFEKNPFLKTPVVRYDEGGEMVNINLPEVTVFPEETYITYTGNESKSFIPTKEEYNEFKANEIRRQALVNMNNRNTPNVPYINNDPAKPGNSCLYTFLSNYPVPLEKSNRVFWELSPEESGFKRVDTALPGDGIQVFSKPQPHRWGSYFWPATHLGVKLKHGYRFPSHMTMFKDINTNGVLIRGSNGSTNPIDTSAIVEERKPISYIHPYNADIYRFVGTKKLLKAWEKEYNNIYKHENN